MFPTGFREIRGRSGEEAEGQRLVLKEGHLKDNVFVIQTLLSRIQFLTGKKKKSCPILFSQYIIKILHFNLRMAITYEFRLIEEENREN